MSSMEQSSDHFEQQETFEQEMREPTASAADWANRLRPWGAPKAVCRLGVSEARVSWQEGVDEYPIA